MVCSTARTSRGSVTTTRSRVQNMPAFDGVKPKRDVPGVAVRLATSGTRSAGRVWPPCCISNSDGMSRRSFRQDFNVEAPMFYDDNWMGNLNYTVNNLEGPLPFTPKFELKLSGSYKIPRRGSRSRGPLPDAQRAGGVAARGLSGAHASLRTPPGGVINPGGLPQIVGVDPNDPDYLPNQHLFDLHLERAFKLGRGQDRPCRRRWVQHLQLVDARSTWTSNSSTARVRVDPDAAAIPLRLALPVLTAGRRPSDSA